MDIQSKFTSLTKNLVENKTMTIKIVGGVIVILLVVGLIFYVINKIQLNKANCDALKKIYKTSPKISSININDDSYKYLLRDYYIKSSYNSCCSGQFKNDYVNDCALKTCIAQGARVLDFEIYSINGEPMIATSSINDYHIKETYNQIAFKDAMETVKNYAFSGGSCPNPEDPLILHFRIQSNQQEIYEKMADAIYSTFENKLLPKEYSYEYQGHNLGAVPLKYLVDKVIIAVDRSNPLYEKTKLNEYVNISSNSAFLSASREYDIKYAPDSQEVIEYNKKNMTFSMPDLSVYDKNVTPSLNFSYGVQWVGMCFQNFDSNMEFYSLYFDKVGHAFVLKPEHLRFVPNTIAKPKEQNPEYSYTSRKVESDFYSFNI